MRRYLLAFLLAFAVFILPFAAFADNTLCYCRYTAPDTDSWDAEDAKWCTNEVAIYGTVPVGPNQDNECRDLCTSNGEQFVGVTSLNMTGFEHPYNRLEDETDYCVFYKGTLSTNPTDPFGFPGWMPRHEDCRAPVNDSETSWPDACSFCFCKFKSGGANSACAGKTTMVHPTSYPSGCPALCEKLGLDTDGAATSDSGDKCDYQTSNGCSQPINASRPGCAAVLNQGHNANADAIGDSFIGSVLTLPLPLSDASLPQIIAGIIRAILSIVGALALALFIWGGLQWMLAAGDPKKVDAAKGTIKAAVVGLIVIFSSYAVLTFIINALTQ